MLNYLISVRMECPPATKRVPLQMLGWIVMLETGADENVFKSSQLFMDRPGTWTTNQHVDFQFQWFFWLGTGASNPMSDWKNFLLSTLLDTGPHDKQFLGPQRPPTWCPMQKRMPCLMHRKGIGALPYFLLVPARNCFRWVHDGAAVRCWTIHSFMNHWISRVYTIVISYDRNLKVTKEKWKFSWWCSFSMYLQG